MKYKDILTNESACLYEYIVKEYAIDDDASKDILLETLLARDRCAEIRRKINEMGITVADRFGQLRNNPLLSYEKDYRSAYLAGIKQLNLSIGIEVDDK